ncbi:hypothetical protein BF28_5494 (plasmid) [Bacillus cereus E33L]|nr:hypothetical protein BF28_5494 [Bacillus cereus E33L]
MSISVSDELQLFSQEIQVFYLQIPYGILLGMSVLYNEPVNTKQKI